MEKRARHIAFDGEQHLGERVVCSGGGWGRSKPLFRKLARTDTLTGIERPADGNGFGLDNLAKAKTTFRRRQFNFAEILACRTAA